MLKLIHFFKNNFFVQNMAARILSLIPPMIEHNLEKYKALRKALYITALDDLGGDYLEFGVFTGSSFVFAARYNSKLKDLTQKKTRFFGFDSFEGFGDIKDFDAHPFYKNDTFALNYEKVSRNIKCQMGSNEHTLVKGYFDQTIKGKTPESFGIQKARIVFIDCDLKDPAADVFNFVKSSLQKGTVLIMDDFYSYKGDLQLGVSGAFEDFKKNNPHISWRRLLDYGNGGIAYICSDVK